MKILCKKTTELSDLEISEICQVFSQTFPDHDRTIAEFKNEFLNSAIGYSYHILLLNDSNNKIIGSQSYIPFVYFIDKKEILIALSVDTMILEKYRNFDNIFDLWNTGQSLLRKKNFSIIIGFPNEQAYPLLIKGMREKEIGKLKTYILPYKISAFNTRLKLIDLFSVTFSSLLIGFSKFSCNITTKSHRISKNRILFDQYRYKWFDGYYSSCVTTEFKSFYKIKKHQGLNIAFLIDVYPMNKKNFDTSVRFIFKNEKNNFDAIIYVGNLHFTPFSLITLPRILEPKKFYFTAKILDKSIVDSEVVFNLDNWDINLSSYDLI